MGERPRFAQGRRKPCFPSSSSTAPLELATLYAPHRRLFHHSRETMPKSDLMPTTTTSLTEAFPVCPAPAHFYLVLPMNEFTYSPPFTFTGLASTGCDKHSEQGNL